MNVKRIRERISAANPVKPSSPLILTLLLLKKSSGASRPIIVKTASFGIVSSFPSRSTIVTSWSSISFTWLFMSRFISPGIWSPGIKSPVQVVTRSEDGVSIETSAIGSAMSMCKNSTFSGLGLENSSFL